jgi:hypothetical protein
MVLSIYVALLIQVYYILINVCNNALMDISQTIKTNVNVNFILFNIKNVKKAVNNVQIY